MTLQTLHYYCSVIVELLIMDLYSVEVVFAIQLNAEMAVKSAKDGCLLPHHSSFMTMTGIF